MDFPVWMLESLAREAARFGVNRQSIVKVWIPERLERAARSSTDAVACWLNTRLVGPPARAYAKSHGP